jgi:two-component system cell cycle sensor histidine kinase/response regulator CckA
MYREISMFPCEGFSLFCYGEKRSMKPLALVVDDDPAILNVTERMLGALGWGTIKANSVDDALELLKTHGNRIDLLLTDVIMPGMDGPGLAMIFAAEKPSARIIFMSGFRNPLHDTSIKIPQGALFLPKPFTYNELEFALNKLVLE